MEKALQHAEDLKELRHALADAPLTVAQISAKFGCSRSAAYARMKALEAQLAKSKDGSLTEIPIRTGRRGPRAVAFRVTLTGGPIPTTFDENLDLGLYSPPRT